MFVYQDSVEKFIEHVKYNEISDIMISNYKRIWGSDPSVIEVNSWQNSLPKVRDLIEIAKLRQVKILLEFKLLNGNGRIDCLLFGKGNRGESNVVLLELKQWRTAVATDYRGKLEKNYYVETFINRHRIRTLHPSFQVKRYAKSLLETVDAFQLKDLLSLTSFSYCHNYNKVEDAGIFDSFYNDILHEYPVYAKSETRILATTLSELLALGDGARVFSKFMSSKMLNKELSPGSTFSDTIRTQPILLNEEASAEKIILARIRKAKRDGTKPIILVYDELGTGIQNIADSILENPLFRQMGKPLIPKSKNYILSRQLSQEQFLLFSDAYSDLYSFRSNNKRILAKGRVSLWGEESALFDEPTEAALREIFSKSGVIVIFIKPPIDRTCMSEFFNNYLPDAGTQIFEIDILTQSKIKYIEWIRTIFIPNGERRVYAKKEVFELRLFDSVEKMVEALELKQKLNDYNRIRILAGSCWSNFSSENHEQVNYVRIDDFSIPWFSYSLNSREEASYQWATAKDGLSQVGDIYLSNGYEFDYVGVIIGDDVFYDEKTDRLRVNETKILLLKFDNVTEIEQYVFNLYLTLISRGVKGCYIYFMDKKAGIHFRQWIE